MGNDLQLPYSHKKRLQELQNKSKSELKQFLILEIEALSRALATIEHEIAQTGNNLKQIEDNTEYYKAVIMELSTKLDQIKLEQINMSLAHENYVNKAKRYLLELEETVPALETDDEDVDDYSDVKMEELENEIDFLNVEVDTNKVYINKKFEELFG